ncbi:transcriptional regulator with XRE-family HTH domain [Streptomyces griseoviridis]|uniref:Transcriptional regulator with XRE-family HTH domain n=1 Tax=Streptomyces griseoviridis TaxID=45398 RepID=A0ABT9LH08_STRGD|nr:transcriptional regulator with XRE-family HTH domain [Streptomyces griseoviridis]
MPNAPRRTPSCPPHDRATTIYTSTRKAINVVAGPTTRRRQLGADLRRLRESKGLTLEEAGARVGISKATLSRYETKEGTVKWPAVDALCREYGASDEERLALVELAKGAKIQGWWRSLADPIPESMNLMLTLEDEVVREDHFACMYVPGLLQTRAYAEAVHRASEVQCDEREVQHMVDIRMRRQELLERDEPPHMWCVIDEAAIRRQVGGSEVMRHQLTHLLAMSQRPNVTVQVLPFTRGAHAAAVGSFVILRGQTRELDVVYVDILGGGLFMEKPKELDRYKLAFEYLSAQALDFESSADLIDTVSQEHIG